ncbi:hypothetical protein CK203_114339 [Vitis vinifera]|uniref:Uncharacterized protein n=1 Tax=Vitis vinifera TaxID=29760 RepID=A0A438EJW9_VITVI|nr:hypothetical protein CK203_114339 [Vitis vinifera]
MSKRGGGAALQKDVPWRASPSGKPIPKIHHSPILRVSQTPSSHYALSIMKVSASLLFSFISPNPIGDGLATEAIVEAAGPDCIVPGQVTPVRLLGLKVLPSSFALLHAFDREPSPFFSMLMEGRR